MASRVGKVEADVKIKASAEQFHDVFCGRLHHLPNICSEKVKSIDIHEGEWGTQGCHLLELCSCCVAKQVVESIGSENNKVTFKVIEGDLLQDHKSFKFILQVTPHQNGSVVHWTLEYEKVNDNIPEPHSLMQSMIEVTNGVGTHLVAAN